MPAAHATLPEETAFASIARRPFFRRAVAIHQELRANRFPNCRKLAGLLEVSPKTIQRDIDCLRDSFRLPIEYDQLQFGFYYSEPVEDLPLLNITEGELLALFIAERALRVYRGTLFEKLGQALTRITANFAGEISIPWSEFEQALSFRTLGTAEADLTLFEEASKAILKKREMVFTYRKLNASRNETRRVQPHHLACMEGQWYLFAFDSVRKQQRTFVLGRIKAAKMTTSTFVPRPFNLSDYLHGSFGVFTRRDGRKPTPVRLQFDAFAGQLVRERLWHSSQKLKELPDGSVELALKLSGFEEIHRWILGWGSHVRVLEPEELADAVRASAEALLAQYNSALPAEPLEISKKSPPKAGTCPTPSAKMRA